MEDVGVRRKSLCTYTSGRGTRLACRGSNRMYVPDWRGQGVRGGGEEGWGGARICGEERRDCRVIVQPRVHSQKLP